MQATLLIDIAARNLDAPITGFEFPASSRRSTAFRSTSAASRTSGAEVWTQQGEAKNMVATVRTGTAA